MQKIIGFIVAPCLAALFVIGMATTTGTATAGKGTGNGMSCKFSSDCESGNCSFKVCKAKSGSSKKLGNGVACKFSSDCDSGNCSFKVCKKR